MRRLARLLVLTAASIIVAGTIASATPGLNGVMHPSRLAAASTGASGATSTASTGISGETGVDGSAEPTEASGATEPSDAVGDTGASGTTGEAAGPDTGASGATGEATGGASDDGTAPDFSACIGQHGLDNAICRHEALLAVDPNNEGLQRSLERLLANQAKHDDQDPSSSDAAKGERQDPGDGGDPSSQGQSDQDHGQSDEPHGRSDEPHGHSDEEHGNPNGD